MSKPLSEYPNDAGFFGDYGGQYVSEILMPLIHELDQLFHHEVQTAEFQEQLRYYYQHYIGRPSPPLSRQATNGSLWRGSNLL